MFLLFNWIIGTFLSIALNIAQVIEAINSHDGHVFKMIAEGQIFSGTDAASIIFYITLAYGLASLLPTLAVVVRRLHDIGKSGWMILIGLIPLVGLYLIYLLAKDSDPGQNAYGPNPKA